MFPHLTPPTYMRQAPSIRSLTREANFINLSYPTLPYPTLP